MTRGLILVDAIGTTPHERSLTTFHDFATQHSGSSKRVRLTAPGSESLGEVGSPRIKQLSRQLQAIAEDDVVDPQQLLAIPGTVPRRMFHLSIHL